MKTVTGDIYRETSLPTRGAWIETFSGQNNQAVGFKSLPTRGAWIETIWLSRRGTGVCSRSPRGERGLKLCLSQPHPRRHESLPTRGAWIETFGIWEFRDNPPRRSPRGERGLKQLLHGAHPRRECVAPHAGSVD